MSERAPLDISGGSADPIWPHLVALLLLKKGVQRDLSKLPEAVIRSQLLQEKNICTSVFRASDCPSPMDQILSIVGVMIWCHGRSVVKHPIC